VRDNCAFPAYQKLCATPVSLNKRIYINSPGWHAT